MEILLEQHFYREKFEAAEIQLQEIFGKPIYSSRGTTFQGETSYFTGDQLPAPHLSWNHDPIWISEVDEHYPSVLSRKKVLLRLREGEGAIAVAQRLQTRVLRLLNKDFQGFGKRQ